MSGSIVEYFYYSVRLLLMLAAVAAIIAGVYALVSRRVAGFRITFGSAFQATGAAAGIVGALSILPALLAPSLALSLAAVGIYAAIPLQSICTARLISGPDGRPVGFGTALKLLGVCLLVYLTIGLVVDILVPRVFG